MVRAADYARAGMLGDDSGTGKPAKCPTSLLTPLVAVVMSSITLTLVPLFMRWASVSTEIPHLITLPTPVSRILYTPNYMSAFLQGLDIIG